MLRERWARFAIVVCVAWLVGIACGGKADRPPVVTSGTPGSSSTSTEPPEAPPEPVRSPEPPEPPPIDRGEDLATSDPYDFSDVEVSELNDRVILEDVRFNYDSAVLEPAARSILDEHARILNRNPRMEVLIEGHCDERGTVQYNLALGERRANSIYNYLMSLGVDASRMKTISYGKEFPANPAHNEAAWAQNRRGRFEITAN